MSAVNTAPSFVGPWHPDLYERHLTRWSLSLHSFPVRPRDLLMQDIEEAKLLSLDQYRPRHLLQEIFLPRHVSCGAPLAIARGDTIRSARRQAIEIESDDWRIDTWRDDAVVCSACHHVTDLVYIGFVHPVWTLPPGEVLDRYDFFLENMIVGTGNFGKVLRNPQIPLLPRSLQYSMKMTQNEGVSYIESMHWGPNFITYPWLRVEWPGIFAWSAMVACALGQPGEDSWQSLSVWMDEWERSR